MRIATSDGRGKRKLMDEQLITDSEWLDWWREYRNKYQGNSPNKLKTAYAA
jgi:hypothetical protein